MEIRKYIALFRHWLWFIAVCAVVAGVGVYLYSRSQPKLYRSTAKFQIDVATPDSNALYVGQIVASNLVKTYLELIPTREVAASTLSELEKLYPGISQIWTPEHILGSISVSSPLESQIIVISAIDTNPARAADIVNTIGKVFAERQENTKGQTFDSIIAILDEQISAYEDELVILNQELDTYDEPLSPKEQLDYDRLDRQIQLAQSGINFAATQRLEKQIERASTINRVISEDRAISPENAFSPRTTTNTVLAIIVGAMIAVGIIALIDYMDDTVKSADEILNSTGLSTLASIAFIEGDAPADRLITALKPRSPISEAFRVLRTNLSFAAIDTGLTSVLVTSSTPSEGKSTSSANIATAMAQTGSRVILIDADLRKPTQHKVLQGSNNHGLTTALLDGTTPASEHLQETAINGLKLMASGPLPPNPAELLNSKRMDDVIKELHEVADVIVIDTPPVLTVADAAILASKVDGCVLVAQLGKTRQNLLTEASERLQASGATVFGIVLNRTNSGRNKYYEYYNEQYYTGEYTAKTAPSNARSVFGRFSRSTGD